MAQRRIFFHIFHSKIPLLWLFSMACEAQVISCLCAKYVETEKVHPVLPEFWIVQVQSLCRGCVRLLQTPFPGRTWQQIRHQPKPEEPWILPCPSAATAEISYCICLHRRVTQTEIKANLLVQNQISSLPIKKRGCFGLRFFFVFVTFHLYNLFSLFMNFCIFFKFCVLVCGIVCRCVYIMV